MRHKNRFYVRNDEIDSSDEALYSIAEDSSDAAPDFIQEALNIKPNESWNLHVAGQEESVFLLGKNVKATDRAKILAVGGEAKVLNAMIEKNRINARKDKDLIRVGEKELSVLLEKQKAIETFNNVLIPEISKLSLVSEAIELKQASARQITNILKNLKEILIKKISFENLGSSLASVPSAISLKNDEYLKVLLGRLSIAIKWSEVKIPKAIELPMFKNTEELAALINELGYVKKMPQMNEGYKLVEAPNVNLDEIEGLRRLSSALSQVRNNITDYSTEQISLLKNIEDIEQEKKNKLNALGSCPTCGVEVGNNRSINHHH
jgi:hypothetical protein